jgi:hypothetical protein
MCFVVCKTTLEMEHAILTTLYLASVKNTDKMMLMNTTVTMRRWQDLMCGRAGRVHKCNGLFVTSRGITSLHVQINKRRRVL